MKRLAFVLPLIAALAACGGTMQGGYPAYLATQGITEPVTVEAFPHCSGYGCREITLVSLGNPEWKEIEAPLKKADDAVSERKALRQSIALFEEIVGARAGTDGDRGGTYVQIGGRQQDCVDESVNTTVYLALLAQRDKLRHHDVGTPTARTFLTSGTLGPHQTAVIVEKDTGARWAVDSWFHDNGIPPEIVPLDVWIGGWRPPR